MPRPDMTEPYGLATRDAAVHVPDLAAALVAAVNAARACHGDVRSIQAAAVRVGDGAPRGAGGGSMSATDDEMKAERDAATRARRCAWPRVWRGIGVAVSAAGHPTDRV